MSDQLLMTEAELADVLRIAPRTVRKWRRDGLIIDPVPGSIPRWNAAEVRRWIDAECPPRDEWRARKGKAEPAAR